MFGEDEVLVPAKDLVGHCGIRVDQSCRAIGYYHILLDAHHIVDANGIAAESLYLGKQGLGAMSPLALKELETILPRIADPEQFDPSPLCRPERTGRRARKLAERHHKNSRPLVSGFAGPD